MAGILSDLPRAVEGLSSSDAATRRMARLFLVSVAGLVTTLVLGAVYFFSPDADLPREMSLVEKDAQNISAFVQKQVDLSKQRASFLQLGTFTIELKSVPGARAAKGILNLAEVEIYVQCDEGKTRDYIFSSTAQMRDRVTRVLPVMDREELLTREGKKIVKGRIKKALNEWIPYGEVTEVFFSKLILH